MEMASRPHGSTPQAPLTQVQQRRLKEWIELVTGKSYPTAASNPEQTTPRQSHPANSIRAAEFEIATQDSPNRKQEPVAHSSGEFANASDSADPENPFDPTAYNQQYALPRQSSRDGQGMKGLIDSPEQGTR